MGLLKRFKAPKATISVTLDKQAFNLNETMTGKFSVSSSEEFDADESRIELWVTEWTKATEKKGSGSEERTVTAEQNAKLHEGKIAVAGRMHITEGFNQQFPFSIPLPSGIPPTYRGHNARNTWRMKGVMAVKGRPDVTSHIMEVQINP
ncbi:MAG: sporulation protein [Candidatus Bathyarchaeia archaeon]|nr:sporulation protein [Candidatus Bathyarchaeia archaeon]